MCTEETLIDIESICIEIFEPILGVIELRTIIVLGFELERGYSACSRSSSIETLLKMSRISFCSYQNTVYIKIDC